MEARSPSEVESQAEKNRRSLLAAETAALALLLRRRNEAVRHGVAAGRSLDVIAERVQSATSTATAQARQLSRLAGIERLKAEARSFGESLGSASDVIRNEVTRDVLRARTYAANYARAWLGKASQVDGSVRTAATEASAATAWQTRRLAVTESAEAFSSGRAKYLHQTPALGLLRVWDAVLDRRTCQTCSALDGVIVGARESFPHGDPPVHNHCRCSWTLLTPTEADGVTTYSPLPDRTGPTLVQAPPKPGIPPAAQTLVNKLTKKPLDDSILRFNREGFRDTSFGQLRALFEAAKNKTKLALSLDPIEIYAYSTEPDNIILQDGRHRLSLAREYGARAIRARITLYSGEGDEIWSGVRKLKLKKP